MYWTSYVSLGSELVFQFKACFWPHLCSSLLNFWCCFLSLPSLLSSFISASVTVDSHSLKVTCLHWFETPTNSGHFHTNLQICAEQEKMWVSWCTSFQLRSNKATLPSCFSFSTVNIFCVCGLFRTMFVDFLFFWLVIFLFKMALQHRAESLSCGLEYRMALTCLMGKMCVRYASFIPGL